MGHTSAVHEAMTFKTSFIFQLQWNLLILAFWHRQKTGFEASERNRDASNASTARKLTLAALRTIRMAAVLPLSFPIRIDALRTWRVLSQIGF